MLFARPYLLALLVPLLYVCWRFRHANRFVTLLRTLLFVSLVLAVAGLTWRMSSKAGYCIALVDRSRSMPKSATDGAIAFLKEMEATRPEGTRLGVLGYSAKTTVEKQADETPFVGLDAFVEDMDASFLADTLEDALKMIPMDAAARIIILGDGQWNGRMLDQAFADATVRGIPVDYRIWQSDYGHDPAIEEIHAPVSVFPGESYVLECMAKSPVECKALLKLRKDNGPWSERAVVLHKGMNAISWSDKAEQVGTAVYEAILETPDIQDSYSQNNRAVKMVTVNGKKSILVITESPSGNLSRILRELQFEVCTERPTQKLLSPALLAACSCVVLENVSASKIGRDGLELLSMMVEKGSVGLVMTGGRNSFANGGYHKSPLEDLLPVLLLQREEERKAQVAMMVALDRSGSMSASAGSVTKMDLANMAALEVFNMLKPDDEYGLLAVDSSSHQVLPLAKVETLGDAARKITSIESQGGGIFTYTALFDATKMLLTSTAQVRHLILFADASDAEEPGKYRELLAKVTAAGITVSTIGLGTEKDCDAAFLMDIANRGKGQVYFTERPDDLPRVFAEDTYKVTLNTFLEGTVSSTVLTAMQEISNTVHGEFSFGGYNLVYPRNGVPVAMVSKDENQGVLCAYHHVGLGRCAILAFEVDGEFTGDFASHPQAASLLGSVVNWANIRQDDTDEYLISQSVKNGRMHLELALDPSRKSDPFAETPEISTIVWQKGAQPVTQKMKFEWTSPDRLEADIPMSGIKSYLPGVVINGKSVQLPPTALPYSPEYVMDENAPARLVELARMTGGFERLRARQVWERIIQRKKYADTMPFFALLSVILLLLEVAERRFMVLNRLAGRIPSVSPARLFSPSSPKTSKTIGRKAKPAAMPHENQEDIHETQESVEPSGTQEDSPLSDALKRASRH